jgi:hypothetical protein
MRWGTQLERGYQRTFAVRVEGIPWVFVERTPRVVTGGAVAPSAGFATTQGLVITSDSETSTDLDRVSGVARGRAFDLRLDLDLLEPNAAALFRTPSIRAPLLADVTNPAATTIDVQDATLPTAGDGYIGREHIAWTGKGTDTITGVTRGLNGLPHWHTSNSASGFAFLTDVPSVWRGRFVEIWEHLVSPDGFMLASEWCAGDYAAVLWRGFIDSVPEVKSRTMSMRCLPLERIMQRELGTGAVGRILTGPRAFRATGFRPATVIVTPADKIIAVRESNGDSIQVPGNYQSGPTDVLRWGQACADEINAAFPGVPVTSVDVNDSIGAGTGRTHLRFLTSDGVTLFSSAWFLGEFRVPFYYDAWAPERSQDAPIITRDTTPMWVFVEMGLDVAARPEAWPTSGVGLIEANNNEVVAWDAIDLTLVAEGVVGVRITRRGLAGTRLADIFGGTEDPTFTVLAGAIGTVEECLRTLLTSSGTGARGAYDMLPPGFGYGVPDAWLDVSFYPLSFDVVEAVGEGESTAEQLIGGWLAARQTCLAQVQRGLDVKLTAVSTALLDSAGMPTLAAGDIVLGTAESQGLVRTPNTVIFGRGIIAETPSIRVRDVPRVQSEGEFAWELLTPNMPAALAVSMANNLMRLSDGQLAARVAVRPSFLPALGAAVRVTAGHPEFYDWLIGDTGTALLGRIVGYSDSLWTGETTRTMLLPAGALAALPLCPAAEVISRLGSSTSLVIRTADNAGFLAGFTVTVYVRGSEDTRYAKRTISAVSVGTTDTLLTLSAGLDLTDYPAGSWVTFGEFGDTSEQDRHTFYGAAQRWL